MGFLAGEPSRIEVGAILRRRPPPTISAVNLTEVIYKLVRVDGRDSMAVNDAIDLLMVGGLEVEPVWLRVTRLAARLRAEHYHRVDSPVSLADCICLATAITLETDLATTDPALARVARAAGVAVIALPDSTGQLP